MSKYLTEAESEFWAKTFKMALKRALVTPMDNPVRYAKGIANMALATYQDMAITKFAESSSIGFKLGEN